MTNFWLAAKLLSDVLGEALSSAGCHRQDRPETSDFDIGSPTPDPMNVLTL
jgi:hypothetical protein